MAKHFAEFVFNEHYAPEVGGHPDPPFLGLLVAGYTAGSNQSESWLIEFSGTSSQPQPVLRTATTDSSWDVFAQPEAVSRLIAGYSPTFIPQILNSVLQPADVTKVMAQLEGGAAELLIVQPGMPFPDAVGLARFLVEVTKGFARYLPGADTVGGPVEVAGITRHEGFKWISRKHYYPRDLNPEEPHAPFQH